MSLGPKAVKISLGGPEFDKNKGYIRVVFRLPLTSGRVLYFINPVKTTNTMLAGVVTHFGKNCSIYNPRGLRVVLSNVT